MGDTEAAPSGAAAATAAPAAAAAAAADVEKPQPVDAAADGDPVIYEGIEPRTKARPPATATAATEPAADVTRFADILLDRRRRLSPFLFPLKHPRPDRFSTSRVNQHCRVLPALH